MFDLICNVGTLIGFVLLLLWGSWYAVKWIWSGAETTTAGQFVGKLSDTTQAYTMYGLLETMKIDNVVKADANALGAIAYLQSVVLRGVAKDWTSDGTLSTLPADENPADVNANTIDWSPEK